MYEILSWYKNHVFETAMGGIIIGCIIGVLILSKGVLMA
jgi:hypothetical protein